MVTGASPRSIGYVVAGVLAQWGADVVATCTERSEALQESLRRELRDVGAGGGNVTAHALDIADAASVCRFVDWCREHRPEVHVLVNNAGILGDVFSEWRVPHHANDGLEVHWRTNFLGTFHLTSLLLPLLVDAGRHSKDARVVNVSSRQHRRGRNARFFADPGKYSSWGVYGQSKLALIHMSFELQRRFAEDSVRSVALHPGSAYTNMIHSGIAHSPALGRLRALVAPVAAWILSTPAQCAQTTIHCASESGLTGGTYYERCAPAEPSREVDDEEASRRLWEEAEDWVRAQRVPGQDRLPHGGDLSKAPVAPIQSSPQRRGSGEAMQTIKVVFPDHLTPSTGGVREIEIECRNYRGLVRVLEQRWPGIEEVLTKTAVAINGQIYQDAWLEPIAPGSEVFFMERIEGG